MFAKVLLFAAAATAATTTSYGPLGSNTGANGTMTTFTLYDTVCGCTKTTAVPVGPTGMVPLYTGTAPAASATGGLTPSNGTVPTYVSPTVSATPATVPAGAPGAAGTSAGSAATAGAGSPAGSATASAAGTKFTGAAAQQGVPVVGGVLAAAAAAFFL